MGQYWYIFSVDNSEILSYIGKLGEFLWDKEADCLVDLLAVPLKRSPVHLSSEPRPVDDISSVAPLPTVANLEPTIQIQPNIVNEGLDEAEVDPDEGFLQGPGNLLGMPRCRFREINSEVEPFRMLLRPVPGEAEHPIYSKRPQTWRSPRTALDEAGHLPKSEHSQAYSFAVGKKVADYYPETEGWILRNLTTAEFVQGDRLFAAFHRSRRQHVPHLGYPGFGEAIMCRIYWSTGNSTVPCAGFNRGIWAGHRLEIYTERIHALNSDCSWKYVTSEIVNELSVALDLPTQTKKSERIRDQNRQHSS